MDDSTIPNIQNDYLNQVRREKTRVAVFLSSGRRITGRIRSFDKFTILLESAQGEQIIFKHAIATVGPSTAPPHGRPRGGFNNRMDIPMKKGQKGAAKSSPEQAPAATEKE